MSNERVRAEERLTSVEEQIADQIDGAEDAAQWAVAEALVAVGHAILATLDVVETAKETEW